MRVATLALALLCAFSVALDARAGDPPKEPAGTKSSDKPAAEPEYKGPEIRWVVSLPDALEEARERNVLVYVHSHGST